MEKDVLLPAANVVGVVPEASLNSGHDEVMLLIVTLAVPVFVTLILFEVDDRPIYVFENDKELGVEVSWAEAVKTRSPLTVRNVANENTLRRMAGIIDLQFLRSDETCGHKNLPAPAKEGRQQ
jgi:hypothetical protein